MLDTDDEAWLTEIVVAEIEEATRGSGITYGSVVEAKRALFGNRTSVTA